MAILNLDNERRYLSNLAQTGSAGERAWAQQQARAYGISLTPAPATGTTVRHSPDQITATPVRAPAPAPIPAAPVRASVSAPAPAAPAALGASTAGLNLDNERRYLSNLAQTGSAGERVWAEQQARAYGISLTPAPTPAPTVRHSQDQIVATPARTSAPTSVPAASAYTAPSATTSSAPATQVYTTPATAAPVTITTSRAPQINMRELLDLIGTRFQGVMYPYQQLLEQLMANRPTSDVQTRDQILQRAQEHANLVFDPQVNALTRALEQQRQAAAAQRATIEATYSEVPVRTGRLLEDARTRAIESAIARGGGASGAVEWLMSQLQAPILERQQQAEASRIAKMTGVTDALSQNERQIIEQMQELETRRGGTAAQQAHALQEIVHAQQTGDWQKAFEAAQALSTSATGAANQAQAVALGLLPYIMPTWSDQEDAARQLAAILGQTPGQPGVGGGVQGQPAGQPVPVRQYVESSYGPQYIGFDSARQEVIIGNYRIAVNRLSEYGGFLRNGQAHLPQSVIDRLMQGR